MSDLRGRVDEKRRGNNLRVRIVVHPENEWIGRRHIREGATRSVSSALRTQKVNPQRNKIAPVDLLDRDVYPCSTGTFGWLTPLFHAAAKLEYWRVRCGRCIPLGGIVLPCLQGVICLGCYPGNVPLSSRLMNVGTHVG